METQPGFTLWLTGMSRSGKSELARHLVGRLRTLGRRVELLDENDVESLVEEGPDAPREIRERNVRQLGWAARLLARNGVVAVVASLSPHRESRDEIRRQIGRYVEVFVDCPFDVLQQRDGAGVYRKALKGELQNVIGVQAPYETSPHFDVTVDTSRATVEEMAGRIFERLFAEGYVGKEEIRALRSPGAEQVGAFGDDEVPVVAESAETEAPSDRPVLRLVPAPEPTLPEGGGGTEGEEGAAPGTDGADALPETRAPGKRKSSRQAGDEKSGAGKQRVGKAGSEKAAATKTRAARADAAEADVARNGPAASDETQSGAAKTGAAKSARTHGAKHGATKTGTEKSDRAKNGTAKTRPAKAGTAKAGTAKAGTAKAGTAKNGAAKNGAAKNGAAKRGVADSDRAKTAPAKSGTTKARAAKAGAEKDGTGRTATARKPRQAKRGPAKSHSAGTDPKAGAAETQAIAEGGDVPLPEAPTKTVSSRNAARVARTTPSKKRQGA